MSAAEEGKEVEGLIEPTRLNGVCLMVQHEFHVRKRPRDGIDGSISAVFRSLRLLVKVKTELDMPVFGALSQLL